MQSSLDHSRSPYICRATSSLSSSQCREPPGVGLPPTEAAPLKEVRCDMNSGVHPGHKEATMLVALQGAPAARQMFGHRRCGDALSTAEKGFNIPHGPAKKYERTRHHAPLDRPESSPTHLGHVDTLEAPQQTCSHNNTNEQASVGEWCAKHPMRRRSCGQAPSADGSPTRPATPTRAAM